MADALDGVTLIVIEREEFEAIAEALAITDDSADFDWIGSQGQGDFKSDDFSRLEAAGESCADAVLTHFGGAPPAGPEFSGLKHFDLQADIDDKAGKAASGCGVAGVSGSSGGLSFLLDCHTK